MVVLLVLREPVIALLFQRGAFGPRDVTITGRALLYYAPQLPFVAVDQLLIAAFYALQNTRLPVVVGVVCAGIYTAVALLTLERMGMAGLVLANTIQNSAHAVILLALLARRHAGAVPAGLWLSSARLGAAAACMAVVCYAFGRVVSVPTSTIPLAGYVFGSVTLGGAAYLLALLALRGEEVQLARGVILSRVRGRSAA
jgi:putative peptidoglycan lipid II flippase